MTREELYAVRDAVMQQARMLNEQTGDRIKVLGEGVQDVREQMGTLVTKVEMKEEFQRSEDAFTALRRQVETQIAALSGQLGAQIAALTRQVAALPQRRRKSP